MSFGYHPAGVETGSAVVSASGTTSTAVQISGCSILGLITPSALDSTSITFEVSTDGSTFVDLYDSSGSPVSLSVTTDAAYSLDAEWFAPWEYVRIVCGTTETAERTFTVVGRPL